MSNEYIVDKMMDKLKFLGFNDKQLSLMHKIAHTSYGYIDEHEAGSIHKAKAMTKLIEFYALMLTYLESNPETFSKVMKEFGDKIMQELNK